MTDNDLQRPLAAADLAAATLPPILRVLLATDGTVTDTLEAWFEETVAVREVRMTEEADVLHREVVLAGERSGRRFAHATSAIRIAALPAALRARLDASRRGIGQALHELRVPTFRAIEERWEEAAGTRAAALGCAPPDRLAARRYAIWHDGRVCIRIAERFPVAIYRTASD